MTEGFLKCIWITITIFLVSSCIEDKPTEPIVQALQAPEISENSEFIVEVISQIPSERLTLWSHTVQIRLRYLHLLSP